MVGDKPKAKEKIVRNCSCTTADFEWFALLPFVVFQTAFSSMFTEFNYIGNSNDECVLVPGPLHFQMTTPAPMELKIGMNACCTKSFYTRLVSEAVDLIMSHPIVVLGSVRRDFVLVLYRVTAIWIHSVGCLLLLPSELTGKRVSFSFCRR